MLEPRTLSLIFNTLKLICGTLAISLPAGTVLGILIARTDLPFRRFAAAALGLQLIVPLYLQAAAWQSGFGLFGWFTLAFGRPLESPWLIGWRGAIFVHAMAALPWVAAIVGLAARQVEPQLEEVALLDAAPWLVFTRVTLRRIWPAIGLAALWVAMLVATDMTVTDLYQVRTYAEEVYIDFVAPADISAEPGAWTGAIVTGLLLAGAIVLCVGGARQSARLLPKQPVVFTLGRWRWPACVLVIFALAIELGLPLVNLIYKAGVLVQRVDDHVERSWSLAKCLHIIAQSPGRYGNEIGLSLLIAFGASVFAIAAAFALAWPARRGGIKAIPAIVVGAAALAIPAPLLGVVLIRLLDNPDLPWLSWSYQTIWAPMLAQAIRALPLVTFIAWFAVRSIPEEQFEASAVDGASGWAQFWRVALPQRRGALVAAWLAAFILAFNELPTTVLLQPPGTMTLPVAVYQLMHGNGEDLLAGIVLLLIFGYAALIITAAAGYRLLTSSRPSGHLPAR